MSRPGSAYRRMLTSLGWRKLRGEKLARNPFCEDCKRAGVLTEASEVHHVIPVESVRNERQMEALAFDPGNLVALCPECHRERHRQLRSHSRDEARRRTKKDCDSFWEAFG